MKTMNYLFTAIFLLMLGSCSTESQSIDGELESSKFKGEVEQEVFELDLQQYYVLGQLADLKSQKRLLEEAIEEGDEDQITQLESVMEQVQRNTELLRTILENSCSYLKIREQTLQFQIIAGEDDAREELEEVREKLEKCDDDFQLSIDLAMETTTIIIAIKKGGNIGGNCHPGEEWTCPENMKSGLLLINVLEDGEEPEVLFSTAEGESISHGEMIGEHYEFEGVNQIAIELQTIENGMLQFNKEENNFEQSINVQ